MLAKKIRVTEIDPGAADTEFSTVRWKNKEIAEKFYAGFTLLVAEDIADAVVYCVTRPLHVNISELVIYPTDQATLTYIHRTPPSDYYSLARTLTNSREWSGFERKMAIPAFCG